MALQDMLKLVISLMCTTGVHAQQLTVGTRGWALRFDGKDDFALLHEQMPPPPSTIEMWVYPQDAYNAFGDQISKWSKYARGN